jgi:hypothetical protein
MEQGIIARYTRRDGHLAEIVGQVPIFIVACLLFATSLAILYAYNIPVAPELAIANGKFHLGAVFLILLVDSAVTLCRNRPARPTAHLFRRYTNPAIIARFVARLPLFLMIIAFMPVFSNMKSMIPLFQPYDWDATFIAWDHAIFGTDAWLFLQPLLGYPLITSALAMLYHAWMLLNYPGTLFILFYSACNQVRHRYFLCYVLIWTILGVALATSLASVGPAFLDAVTGDPRFVAQTDYLRAAGEFYPVPVVNVQELLLEWYHSKEYGLGRGITAMPSMHVSMAFLYFLAIRHVSRWAGRFFFVFFVVIWLGSVHLGYHYAVDGLISVIGTSALWLGSKKVIDWWERVSPKPVEVQQASGTMQPA